MRKITIFLILILFACFLSAQINETFETGLPPSAPASETTAMLSTGVWKLNGTFGKSDNGSNRLAMNTAGYAITPPIDKPLSLSFNHRGSGSGKVLTVEKSIDNGSNWTTIGTATVSSSSTYGSSNMSVGEAGTRGVLIRFSCGSATIYIDNVEITVSTMGDEPTTQASISASEVTGSTMKINFTKGNGDGRLLVYSKGTPVTWTPTDGTAYLNLPKSLDTNLTGAYSGNNDNVLINGLEAGETYYFSVFEYKGSNENTNYLTSTVGQMNQKTSEVSSITINPSSINFGSVKTGTISKRSFTVSAKYLTPADGNILVGSITLEASSNFLISTSSSNGFSSSINLPYTANSLETDTIYIQFMPTDLQLYSYNLTLIGGGASAQLQLLGTGSNTDAKVYYIAPTGNDNNEGTFDSPWYNIQKAVDAMLPGDTVICRGGTYFPTMMKDGTKTTVRLTALGTNDKHLTIKNYPGEFPIFNFKDQPKKVSVRGFQLDGNYWHIFGIHITQAGDNGIKLEGNYNKVERVTFSYNDDTGIQLGFGHVFSDTHPGISSNNGTYCCYNDIVDCDSYLNCDADNFGSDADGFACKMHNGKGNRFIRCRAWDNADDAWDLYETDYSVQLIDCWAWGSGRAENFTWVDAIGSFQGNGNGIKMGGNGTGGSSEGIHEAWNCVAFNCNKTGSVKGFDQNSHGGGEKLVNCLAFGCGYDFMFEKSSTNCEYYNNVCFGNIEIAGGLNSNNAMLSATDKAWTNVIRGFGASDYVSLSEDDAKAPRGADGSLPAKFARLKTGSVLVDKGLPYNMPYTTEFPFLAQPIYGTARDLGPYELQEGDINSGLQVILNMNAKLNLSVLPNPCKTEAVVKFSTENSSRAVINICNLNGQLISEAYAGQADSGVEYFIPVSVSTLGNGIYLCRLIIGNQTKTNKIIVVR
ncbi:MAG: T9SS type A sorting domain-containing protein [Paludibacter sp.]